jgi:hypothetical protein
MDAHFITTSDLVCHWVPVGSGDLHRACHSVDDVLVIECLLTFIEFLLQWISVAVAIGIYAIVVIMLNILSRLPRIANKPFISNVITVLKASMVCSSSSPSSGSSARSAVRHQVSSMRQFFVRQYMNFVIMGILVNDVKRWTWCRRYGLEGRKWSFQRR